MSGQEVAKTQSTPPAQTIGLSDNITQQDMRIPRIELTQSLSPVVIDGLHKPGILINSLTKEELKTPIIVPIMVFKNIIRWKPRTEGGGILYKTMNVTPEVAADLRWEGDQKPKATAYLNAICLVEGQDMPLVASFCNTSYKAGQDLVTLIQFSGLAWKYSYMLGAKKQTNAQGTFYTFCVSRGPETLPEQREAAAAMFETVKRLATLDIDYAEDTSTAEPVAVAENKDGL